ncbi:MAG: hypothetical protein ACOZCL_13855 [Bacillota bacterium]
MKFFFFYIPIIVIWAGVYFISRKKTIELSHIVIGITTIGYSAIYDLLLGVHMKLYYYISPDISPVYIAIAAAFIYPPLNMIYTMFLPEKKSSILIYTLTWTAFMLAFELVTVYFGTIVFRGWRVLPWSVVTYIVTYILILLLFFYLDRKTGCRC